jgi:hypothetical protein
MEGKMIGVFSIGTGMPGAPLFKTVLTFWNGAVSGQGQVTQAINPPLDVTSFLSGSVHEIVWGADVQTVITLTGHQFATPTPPNPVNVDCAICIDSRNMSKAAASLSYMDQSGKWTRLTKLPVKVDWISMPQ